MKHGLLMILLAFALGVTRPAHAAKLIVFWAAVTTNTDNTPIKDLAGYRVEWGSCNKDGTFGTFQAGVNVGPTVTRTAVYPTGLSPVCLRLFAYNTANVFSGPTNTISAIAPPKLSQPTH